MLLTDRHPHVLEEKRFTVTSQHTTSSSLHTQPETMQSLLVLIPLYSALVSPVLCLSRFRAVDVLNSHLSDEGETTATYCWSDCDCDVQELFLEQRLDHFHAEDSRRFSQRFFYTDRFVRHQDNDSGRGLSPPREVAFLCVGGEGPALNKTVLINSVHCSGDMLLTAAQLYEQENWSVHLYALEHRYYGESYPVFAENHTVSPVANKNLVFLSSRQALHDLAHFSTTLQPSLPWITFGGSYPGMLAAWARLKFPHIVAAAVSNSAPIQAVLDFAAYNNHVAHDLKDPAVGGSDECLELFVQGHVELIHQIENASAAHAEVAEQFGLCHADSLQDPRNVQLFVGDGAVELGTQSNDPGCTDPLCNLDSICRAALQYYHNNATIGSSNHHPAMDTLAWLARQQRAHQSNSSDDCLELDWKGTLDLLADPVRGRAGGLRSWLWQTCTEFGFYPTCELHSTCPYGRGWHLLSQDLEMCRFAFGATNVMDAVHATNEYYGGWDLAGSRILSVTGTIDPWTELAKTTSSDYLLPVYMVQGASHHFWTHPVKTTDSDQVQMARVVVYETIRSWLDEISGADSFFSLDSTQQA